MCTRVPPSVRVRHPCTFGFLAKRVTTALADKNARELLEMVEREREGVAARPSPSASKPKKKKSKRASPPMAAWRVAEPKTKPVKAPVPVQLPAPALRVELVSDSFVEEQARILNDIHKACSKACDMCLEMAFSHTMARCRACGAQTLCGACMESLKDIGAQCTRCNELI
jgi:hypothetical protein